jgi:hypothetical protein
LKTGRDRYPSIHPPHLQAAVWFSASEGFVGGVVEKIRGWWLMTLMM